MPLFSQRMQLFLLTIHVFLFGLGQNIRPTDNVDHKPMHSNSWDKALQNQVLFFSVGSRAVNLKQLLKLKEGHGKKQHCHSVIDNCCATVLAKTLIFCSRSFLHLPHRLRMVLFLWQLLWPRPCDEGSWCSAWHLPASLLLLAGSGATSLAHAVFRLEMRLQVCRQATIIFKP